MILEMQRKEIGQKVRSLRNKFGYTKERLSDLAVMSSSFLSKLEQGEASITEDHLIALSKAFNCSPEDIKS